MRSPAQHSSAFVYQKFQQINLQSWLQRLSQGNIRFCLLIMQSKMKLNNSIIKYIRLNSKNMFKKRVINKESLNSTEINTPKDCKSLIERRPVQTGIDLRKDIQEMEQIIGTQKQAKGIHFYEDQDDEKKTQKHESSVFKTKKINKFTSHILKNLPTRNNLKQTNFSDRIINQDEISPISVLNSRFQQSKSNTATNQPMRPQLAGYGLIDMTNYKSTLGKAEAVEFSNSKNHQQALIDYYIKKRMEEMNVTKSLNPTKSLAGTSQAVQKQPDAWQEVLQIQKQYLTKQEKIKQYSMQELQKKLQKLAQQTIKTQIEKRNVYLKDLLENQHERMEYASKKELKVMKQEKERIEKELNSKYKDFGRRNFIQNIKSQVI